ncbi:tape measure protein [Streptococcus parasuis]|uniref:tape measure protein n=1 Tax=Streptococcus parasuis TaxID=1501662 RepID=UPI0025A5A76B|nr:tape measure protein [Streptococcus parasuis]WJQ86093.1 tape measure protein [Streptococcus parasuis]
MAKVQATMSTEIALDLVKASESIKSMTNLVNSSTSAWKAQESQLKATGDYLGATKAKYEGLGSAIQAQQVKIEALKQKQSELKGDTQQTAEQYLKFQQQIDQATTKLSSLEAQQNKAKQSMSYYQSGLADLQKGYRLSNDLSESYVKRLQAEGRESEVLQAKLNASKNAVNNLNKQYEAQVKLLKEVAQSGDGDAYVKQKIRINETASAIANAKREQIELSNELRKANPTFFDKLKAGIHETSSKIDELGKNVNRSNSILGTFREKLSFGAIAGMASSAIQSVTSSVMGLSGEVLTTSDALDKFESTMNFAGKTKKETEEASKYFKTYADKTVYELQDVANTGAQLASNGIEKYKEITIASGNLNAVAGGNKETFKSLGMVLTQTAGAGKLTTENWNQLADAIPGASGKLQETLSKNGAFVGNFREAMENGEISSEEFLTAIEQLGNSDGAEKAAMSTKTFEGAFGSLTSAVVSGMNEMVDVVGKENITKRITGFGDTVKNVFDYLKDHKKELSSIGKSIFEISKIFGMAVWDTAKDTIKLIADSFNMLSGDSKKAKDPLHTVSGALKSIASHKEAIQAIGITFASYFIATKVINGIKTLITTMRGIPLAFNAIKVAVASNPLGIFLVAVTTVSVALYELYKHNKKFKEFVDDLAKNAKKAFDKTVEWFKDIPENLSKTWDKVKGGAKKGIDGLKSVLDDTLEKIKDKFSETWDGIKKGFGDMWDGMKRLAGDGINAVIKIPNAGISGINNLIADFGGPKNAISKIPEVKFATGTGMFSNVRRAITKPTLAMLNDGHDSPETGHQEAVIMPNGEMVLPRGRNSRMVLPAGAEVLNATELKMLISMQAMPFASGTGFWSKLWDSTTSIAGNAWDGIKDTAKKFTEMLSFIGSAIKDPVGTLAKKFNPNANKLDGVFNPLGNALFEAPKAQAKSWWSELWNMANKASEDSGGVKGNTGLQNLIKRQVGGMFDWISKFLAPETDADPVGSGVERWRGTVVKALRKNGLPTTDSYVNAWLRQIKSESGGNPKAVQGGYVDINTITGDLAKGLVQTISATFNANAFPGHNDIFNGYDNLLAGIRYAKNRYGASMLDVIGHGHGYANGGLVSKHGVYELAEGNMPEYIIPTDSAKRSRAWTLLAEVVGKFAGEAPKPQNSNTDNQAISKLEAKFDAVIGLLTQLVANGQQPINIQNIVDGQSFANGLAPYMYKAQNRFEIRQGHLGGGKI